jgi:hypothetical protein
VETPKPRILPIDTNSSNGLLDTTSDSIVLDQTLSLLYTLKDLMTGQGGDNMNEREVSVLEQLEVLSVLMQDQSSLSYQSMLSSSSPRRDEKAALSDHPTTTSLDFSRDDHDEDDDNEGAIDFTSTATRKYSHYHIAFWIVRTVNPRQSFGTVGRFLYHTGYGAVPATTRLQHLSGYHSVHYDWHVGCHDGSCTDLGCGLLTPTFVIFPIVAF